jgi:hypothetical protein
MGYVYADVELINALDLGLAKRHIIGDEEIKRMHAYVLVDSGSNLMAINDTIQEILDLPFIERRRVRMADESIIEHDIVGPLMIKFANRIATCSAYVLPGNSEPLLGAIPMEEMDVLIHPARQELIVNPAHPDGAIVRI